MLNERQLEEVRYGWDGVRARKEQIAPAGDWRTWLLLAGRGFGKTRTGAEWVRSQVWNHRRRRVALVAPTAADARDVIVEGESGLLNIGAPKERPYYEPSKRRLTWPNGAIATTYSADEPERLRGPQHDAAYCDEVASWRYPEAYDMLLFGLRLGDDPRVVVTTTPKPVKIVRELVADPTTVVTRGSTYENRANLATAFLAQIIKKYEGTRLGRQEIEAEVLDDVPGALWTRGLLEELRWPVGKPVPDLSRIVVAIDEPGQKAHLLWPPFPRPGPRHEKLQHCKNELQACPLGKHDFVFVGSLAVPLSVGGKHSNCVVEVGLPTARSGRGGKI